MTTMLRFYVTGLALAAGLTGIVTSQPTWLAAVGIEVATLQPAINQEVMVPDAVCHMYQQRITAKIAVMKRLRSGELNLFEAATWFRYLNQEPTKHIDHAWKHFPGESDEEKVCRQVIVWAKGHFSGLVPESELEQLLAKLEQQLSDRLCERGRVELPMWQ